MSATHGQNEYLTWGDLPKHFVISSGTTASQIKATKIVVVTEYEFSHMNGVPPTTLLVVVPD